MNEPGRQPFDGELASLMARGLVTHEVLNSRIKEAEERITGEMHRHFLSYRGLLGIWWQLLSVILALLGIGASLALAGSRFID